LKPRGYNLGFICPDVKYCEIAVLQWLSGDSKLKKLLESDEDLYSGIFTLVTDLECNTPDKRRVGKEAFLMVVYGAGKTAVANKLGISEGLAKSLVSRIYEAFPEAMNWIKGAVAEAEASGTIRDYFGRPRTFTAETAYGARNFVVQGVAATVCLEILVELYKLFEGTSTNLCFSIHDGYGIVQ
jgi:DNA polymerase I-like protein with 3'-5' exonuclease and polymerase domains